MTCKALTGHTLAAEALAADRAAAEKIGNSAVGEKALYLPGKLFACARYIPLDAVTRAYLRVMAGGSGKASFRQPLLVIEADGKELSCVYREEQTVRDILAALAAKGVATGKPRPPKPN